MTAPDPTRPAPAGRGRRRAARAALALAAALGALAALGAPAATADSISYVRDGDVWLATPDGSREFRVTERGGYSDATQADDGTIVALRGVRLHRLDRLGNVLADFATPVSDTRPPGERQFYGPYEPAISPDGRIVAYSFYFVSEGSGPGCEPPECIAVDTRQGVGYTFSDRQTAWDQLGRHTGWIHPSWLPDGRVMLSTPGRAGNVQVVVDEQIDSSNTTWSEWFSDTGTPRLDAGEATRQGTKLAFVAGEADEQLRLYRMTGAAPAVPQGPCYGFVQPAGRFASPSWSPDGTRLAWAEDDGVYTAPVPSFADGCTTEGAEAGRRVLAGAGEPDWGRADVPAGGPGGGDTGGGGTPPPPPPGGGGGGDTGGRPDGGAQATIAVRRARLRAALARGLVVALTRVAPGTAVEARRGRTLVARGTARGTAERASARLRFTPRARRQLRRLRSVTLRIRAGEATAVVRLRR